jgi:hypothetical protein
MVTKSISSSSSSSKSSVQLDSTFLSNIYSLQGCSSSSPSSTDSFNSATNISQIQSIPHSSKITQEISSAQQENPNFLDIRTVQAIKNKSGDSITVFCVNFNPVERQGQPSRAERQSNKRIQPEWSV